MNDKKCIYETYTQNIVKSDKVSFSSKESFIRTLIQFGDLDKNQASKVFDYYVKNNLIKENKLVDDVYFQPEIIQRTLEML